MGTTAWVILAIANIPVYWVLGWVWFKDWDEFREAIGFWLTPDILSAFQGEYMADWWAELKLGLWFASCAGSVFAEAYLLSNFFA